MEDVRRQLLILVSILLGVIGVDQVSKAWAWRHLDLVWINSGGSMIAGPGIGALSRAPVTGALLDVLDAVLLTTALVLLARRRRNVAVLVSTALVLAGWSSNLLDRLGMHYVTAPGSVRGAVDFVPWLHRYWNLADFVIIIGTAALLVSLALVAVGMLAGSTRRRAARMRSHVRRPLAGARRRAIAATGMVTTCVLATIGAAAYTGVNSTVALAAAR